MKKGPLLHDSQMPLVAQTSKALKSKVLNMTNSYRRSFVFFVTRSSKLMSRKRFGLESCFLCLQELTGAPLISYVPKNRRIKKKMR
jgi:hypothetical protein